MKLSLVPQEQRLYALFLRQGELVAESLDELRNGLRDERSTHRRLRDLEHACDDVTRDIYMLINRTLVTPIERDDIYKLASDLDSIVDLAEEISDKLDLYGVERVTARAREMGEALAAAGTEIRGALAGLEGFHNLSGHREEIHRLENLGDRITREALAELFSGNHTASELVKWKDIYDMLETTMDSCEKISNLLETIAISNG